MKTIYTFTFSLIAIVIFLTACSSQSSEESQQHVRTQTEKGAVQVEAVPVDTLQVAAGQVIYVPAYSEIFFEDTERTWDFAITLAVHNTDFNHPIIVRSVRYFDTNGDFVREYTKEPLRLKPLATTGFVVERSDTLGGVGANFIVEWVAETKVTEPVVEAVMISASGTQGLSLISPGRIISQTEQVQSD